MDGTRKVYLADIFISYARADKVRVERLVAALQANGWKVWWDAEVSPGEQFDDVIAAALERRSPATGC